MRDFRSITLSLPLLLGACATAAPVVDFETSRAREDDYPTALAECGALADESGQTADVAQEAAVQGAIGAGLGALAGALTGSGAATGAIIGGVTGAVAGGAGAATGGNSRSDIVAQCLEQRGYNVVSN